MRKLLKRQLNRLVKRKGAVVLFLMALSIFIFGVIFVLQSSTKLPEEKVIHSMESNGSNRTEGVDNNEKNLLITDNIVKTTNCDLDNQNNESVDEKDIPFLIETIGVNEAVCVGKVELKSGYIYEISASAESGEKIFVALNESCNVNLYKGIEWKQFTGISGTLIEAQFTDLQTGFFYVYVGNTGQEALTNVEVLITANCVDETTSGDLEIHDRVTTVEKDIPFLIETIGVNEAVCVGKIELKSGYTYEISALVESGEKIFVALNESGNVISYKGIEWKQFAGITDTLIEAQFTDLQTGTFYVYVGNTGKEPLINVNGILYAEVH